MIGLRRGLRGYYSILIILLLVIIMFQATTKLNLLIGGGDVEDEWERAKRDLVQDVNPVVYYVGPFPDSKADLVKSPKLIDWHDYEFIAQEQKRKGLGEQGNAASLPSDADDKERETLQDAYGFNALLSNLISINRSLSDVRPPKCKTILYRETLPTVSVVIPVFEEHESTLKRTVMSVINRSPTHLLKEIILVDDGSLINPFLKEGLHEWVEKHTPKLKFIRLKERIGLMIARQEGARAATGDVIVILDSHCEVMTNWLPPLLDIIVNDYRTCVCPSIDNIAWSNFAYSGSQDGNRGAFDWHFAYQRLPLKRDDRIKLPEPFENPIMIGGLFAISRQFFWELGGYDEGLRVWGGEQFELSFKNYKRIASIWLDEYAEAIYRRKPRLRDTDPGDISKQLEIKEMMNCKPFKWFLSNIAPDIVQKFDPFPPPDFAYGTIKSVAAPNLCADNGSKKEGPLILYPCHGMDSQESQRLQTKLRQLCLEANIAQKNLIAAKCDSEKQEQKWIFQHFDIALIKEKFPPFS